MSVALPTPLSVIAAYAVLVCLVMALWWLGGRSQLRGQEVAAAWRRTPARRRVALASGVAGVAALAWIWITGPPAPPSRLTVSFLDVGQGDATLIQDGAGAAVLFDGGPPQARCDGAVTTSTVYSTSCSDSASGWEAGNTGSL